MVLRSAAGGLVMCFVLVLAVPNLSALLATSQDWSRHAVRGDEPDRRGSDWLMTELKAFF